MKTIEINTGKKYQVLLGRDLISKSSELIKDAGIFGKVCIITDKNLEPLYLDKLASVLSNGGFDVCRFVVDGGESSKSGQEFLQICEFLAKNAFTRTDCVLALGGGIVGDLTGFVASAFARGIKFVQMPTSLLSLVDSSVGGKTAINLSHGKNLVGAFYQPNLVIGDLDTLNTLPEVEFACGMAEVIKYATVFDKSLFELLERNDKKNLETIVERCIIHKKNVVELDEFDNGQRQLLNFGHTLGHAIEKISQFSISHGVAVGLGMIEIVKACIKAEYCEKNVLDRLCNLLELNGLMVENPYSISKLYETTLIDKKRKGDNISAVVCKGIGECVVKEMSMEKWKEFILG